MEYSCFNFRPFGVAKRLCTLEYFVHFVDDEFDFVSFADLLPTCAKDVVAGLKYKAARISVSFNKYYELRYNLFALPNFHSVHAFSSI
jgi:hypothetical protein